MATLANTINLITIESIHGGIEYHRGLRQRRLTLRPYWEIETLTYEIAGGVEVEKVVLLLESKQDK